MDSAVPLTPKALVAAVCHSTGGLVPHDPDIDVEFVLEACHNLVVVVGSTCRFAHLSIQEYLESHEWPNKPDNQLLGAVCLHLLMAPESIFSTAALRHYVARNWHKHLTDCDPEPGEAMSVTSPLLSKFLGSPTESSSYYIRWFIGAKYFDVTRGLGPSGCAAFGAVGLGLLATVARWIENGTLDPNLSSSDNCLLHLAVERGNLSMCSQLLDAGANVNETSLVKAVRSGQLSILELLIKQPGMVIDKVRNRSLTSPLCTAVSLGAQRAVELLLDAGANPDLMGDEDTQLSASRYNGFTPALHVAASQGSIDIVRTLIQAGADVNLVDGSYQTPLTNAVNQGHEAIVHCLIQNGADVNLFRPLYRAVPNLGVKISKISMALIDGGALDFAMDLPRAERTKLDVCYEKVMDWLDMEVAKSHNERRNRRFMRMFNAGAFRTVRREVRGEERGGSERGGDENGDIETVDVISVSSI